jgi:hypothetical protein
MWLVCHHWVALVDMGVGAAAAAVDGVCGGGDEGAGEGVVCLPSLSIIIFSLQKHLLVNKNMKQTHAMPGYDDAFMVTLAWTGVLKSQSQAVKLQLFGGL